ncbi:serine hydrolase domain-containing protein [Candidatus Palauibacter sp.]|uniref:serine hydrolase domain-containing protein n=1 Tax=Candidatus Palauibacter sp. TaxID=3101350 RepID=UPI003C6EC0EE
MSRARSCRSPGRTRARWADVIAASRGKLDSLQRAMSIPGLSIAVSVDRRVVWSEGMGYADLELRSPATPLTRYRIGSVSKILTAAGAALLHQRGQLDLDAPVQAYLPSFPHKPEGEISTRLLAGHLAGIRHYEDIEAEYYLTRRYETVFEALEIFPDDPLVATPGTGFSYSSYGFNLMSAVIAAASGRGFLQYLDEEVFRPLGMLHTGGDHTDSLVVNRARPYDRAADGRLINARYIDNSHKWAGGGFLSTTEDLLRFAHAHLEPDLFQPETLELLWTPQRTVSGEEIGVGIGWRLFPPEMVGGRRAVGHAGGAIGGNALLLIYPDEGVAVAVAANIADIGYPQGGGLVFGDVIFEIADLFIEAR